MTQCGFNAEKLLVLRRSLAETFAAADEPTFRKACDLIAKLDDMRKAHEAATGCKCWAEAQAKHPSLFEVTR